MSDAKKDADTMEVDEVVEKPMEQDDVVPSTSKSSPAINNTVQNNNPGSPNVMASPATVPSVTISLHPLVILNISEHWTRIRAQSGGAKQQVIGALIGKQQGRHIEVLNSFELKCDFASPDNIIIDREYYNTKEEQFKQVFSDLDFLGWYTTGGEEPTQADIFVHKQICQINECPVMMQLNPSSKNVDKLPIGLYESVIDIVQGEATMLFVPLTYTLATEEAERIGVDHVARMRMSTNDATDANSVVAEHLIQQHGAIKMLHSRVKIILAYMKELQRGTVQPNHEILREAYGLSHRLPIVQTPEFRQEFYTQSNDVGLITYLGTLTKGCNDMNQLVNKFNVLYGQKMSRRMRGHYF